MTNMILALALAVVFRLERLSDASAIFLIAAALSVAQVLHWLIVCKKGQNP